ncbi:Hypothetical predicted protein, partial [Paramuricea clavata]
YLIGFSGSVVAFPQVTGVTRDLYIVDHRAKDSQGPILVPCGIPAGTISEFEKLSELSFRRCGLPRRKSAIQFTTV